MRNVLPCPIQGSEPHPHVYIPTHGGRPLRTIPAADLVDLMLLEHGGNLPGSEYTVREMRAELLRRVAG